MSNLLDRELPRTHWQAVPPIGPDGIQLYLERGRQLRAEAFAYGLRRAARALASAFRSATRFVRDVVYVVARRPTRGDYATTGPGRLTGGRG
jgi:hypothetical protein